MTPPTLERAVEILTAAAAAHAPRTEDQAAQLIAAAIDVVLARLAAARRIEAGLTSWRADVEAATLDHGWMIIQRIDELLDATIARGLTPESTTYRAGSGPLPSDHPAAPPPPFEPLSDARLREIAHGVDVVASPWPDGSGTPLEVEMGSMAAELLSARNALRYHEAHQRMRTGLAPAPDGRTGDDAAPLPCPFCGTIDRLRVESHPDRDLGSPGVTLACVRCRACGCAGPAERGGPGTRADAIAHWNSRQPHALNGTAASDVQNLQHIRRAINRTAYHGGLGLRESGRYLSTMDRLLASFGVGPDDHGDDGLCGRPIDGATCILPRGHPDWPNDCGCSRWSDR